ncbi:MAG: hypothetical protein HRU41_04690 [Saprospiraceae bacterium]|nr:hypothetical protein [Saprospiraceae bacterium]
MKLTAILLAFYIFLGSLFPGTDYGQFLRISDLVQHIQVHRLEAAEVGQAFSWKQFVYDHFINPDQHEHSNQTDNHELPFHVVNGTVLVWVGEVIDLTVNTQSPQIHHDKAYFNPFHLNGFQRSLKQPPAIA